MEGLRSFVFGHALSITVLSGFGKMKEELSILEHKH